MEASVTINRILEFPAAPSELGGLGRGSDSWRTGKMLRTKRSFFGVDSLKSLILKDRAAGTNPNEANFRDSGLGGDGVAGTIEPSDGRARASLKSKARCV
jgi:hypothetical protein